MKILFKIKFRTDYINETLLINNKQAKESIMKQILEKNYHKINESFDYLSMDIISVANDKINELEKQIKEKLFKEITDKIEKNFGKKFL